MEEEIVQNEKDALRQINYKYFHIKQIKYFVKMIKNINWQNALDISILKTIYINFKYLDFHSACKFPIWISRKTLLYKPKYAKNREIIINGNIYPGMIKIGFGTCTLFDKYKSRTIFLPNGIIEFGGATSIGHGSKIVCINGYLKFGNNVSITAETTIACKKKIVIGDDCLLSWDVIIMDSDCHDIYCNESKINEDNEILIGDHVWVGCRSVILKGVVIPNNCIVGASSVLAKKFENENEILLGSPAKAIKNNIRWEK